MTLAGFCTWAGRFESYLVETPEDTFLMTRLILYMYEIIAAAQKPCILVIQINEMSIGAPALLSVRTFVQHPRQLLP